MRTEKYNKELSMTSKLFSFMLLLFALGRCFKTIIIGPLYLLKHSVLGFGYSLHQLTYSSEIEP